MNDVQMLAGSLSNDLMRVASLVGRGSIKAASRFLLEAKRWSIDLEKKPVADYIKKIARDISERDESDISQASAEQYLMYGVLLQNYCLHSNVDNHYPTFTMSESSMKDFELAKKEEKAGKLIKTDDIGTFLKNL